jgi:hypothetical protein
MSDKLLKVLSRLFNPRGKKNTLLKPVGELHEVVALESSIHVIMWHVDEEVLCLVPPGRQTAHDVLAVNERRETLT